MRLASLHLPSSFREKTKMKSYAVFLSQQTIYTLVISS
ncbi:hypothetical protein Goarm_003297 [Gossypium armourianum]|uniref:Uncharacterized protein n=1 Tax=Gossypium armourianum TaxID=34283 RepID=A0A7J9K375_9ROSI|nr:hypothetical protein [Gossypium armourianum]